MRRVLLAVALSAAIAATIRSAGAAEWTIDPAASRIAFSGTQAGQKFAGGFARFTGTVSFDPDHPDAGSADVSIDMASAATGDAQRDAALPQPEWFDVRQFPTAAFHAASFRAKGGNAYDAVGTLTVRGISAEVTLPFTLAIDAATAKATGHADLIRSAFGIGQGPWASAQWVALEVGVDVEVVARRRG